MTNVVCMRETITKLVLDLRRYPRRWYVQPGFWVTVSYRVRRLRKLGCSGYCRLLLPVDMFFGLVRRCLSDVIIPSEAVIDAGLYMPHPTGVVIHEDAVIGKYVAIYQQVTIGEWKGGVPVIGDGCALYPGSKVFGELCLGERVMVGANAVVVDSFSDGEIAAGVPAKNRIERLNA